MNVRAGNRRLLTRSLLVIIPLVALLVVSGIWNVRQYQVVKQERLRAAALEREEAVRVAAEADRAEARRKKNAEWAASDARMQQLYREINSLSRINEQISADPVINESTPSKRDSQELADGSP
jgi:sensor c-di-GMP phosphodiesterase-like protein